MGSKVNTPSPAVLEKKLTVATFAALATTKAVIGQVVKVKGDAAAGVRSADYVAEAGSGTETEPNALIQSATAGIRWRRVGIANRYTYNINNSTFAKSYNANVNSVNSEKEIYLFGDSHSWGQGAPEWDSGGPAVDISFHSASLFNKGFMGRIEEYIEQKRHFDERIYSLSGGLSADGTRLIASDAAQGDNDYLVHPLQVISGRVLSRSIAWTAAGSTLKGWFTPFATGDNALTDIYRDKIFMGRFNRAAFDMYPETEANFLECGKAEYLTLLPAPGVAATGGYTSVVDSCGNIIAEYNGAIFYLRISAKTPYTEMGFFNSNPQNIFLPGYGKVVTGGNTVIGAGAAIAVRIFAADGASYPAGLEKYLFSNMRIYKDDYVKKTTVMASPKRGFRKLYICVHTHNAGRKIAVGLGQYATKGGVAWHPNGHLANISNYSLKPQWNFGASGYPVISIINGGGSKVSAAGSATVTAIGAGSALVIDTYSASDADVVYEIDFGSKVQSEIYIQDYAASASGTSQFSTLRGLLLDNNTVTNWAMGGHTIGNWLGVGDSFNDVARDHLADILAYGKTNPYLVITELPLVNEYLHQTPLATFKNNIATFISRLNNNLNPTAPARTTSFLFFTTIGHRDGEFEGTVYPALSYQNYADAAKEQCLASGVGFLDLRQMVKDKVRDGLIDYRLLYSDNIHPSGLANELMARQLLDVLDEII